MLFRDLAMVLTDIILLLIYVAGMVLAVSKLRSHRRASRLVLMALFALSIGKLATYSVAAAAWHLIPNTFPHAVLYVKMANSAILIFAVSALVSAVYVGPEPATLPDDWDKSEGEQPSPQGRIPISENPYQATQL